MKANNARDSLVVLVLSGMIDAGFVLVWIITQFLVSRFVFQTWLVVSSMDSWVVLMFQLIFAISTLAPIAFYVVRDLTVGIRRLEEIQKGL
jgi:hypothetical protein